jgi:uncharacterized protein (TIGR02996 family)
MTKVELDRIKTLWERDFESRKPFLLAIRANPKDDLPKLIFADWLEEHGHYDEADVWRTKTECEIHRVKGGTVNLDHEKGVWYATIYVGDRELDGVVVPFPTKKEAVDFLAETHRQNHELPSSTEVVQRPADRGRRFAPRHGRVGRV